MNDRNFDEDAAMQARIDARAEALQQADPTLIAEADAFVARLTAAGVGEGAPKEGDVFPSFVLPDDQGRLVTRDALCAQGPVILLFLRGHWCPYCQVSVEAINAIRAQADQAGVTIAVVSPERPKLLRPLFSDLGDRFVLLADAEGAFALTLSLSMVIDDSLAERYRDMGFDLATFQMGGEWIVPIPAGFVLDEKAVVRARHVDPNYRLRPPYRQFLAVAEAARDQPKS